MLPKCMSTGHQYCLWPFGPELFVGFPAGAVSIYGQIAAVSYLSPMSLRVSAALVWIRNPFGFLEADIRNGPIRESWGFYRDRHC